MLKLAILFLFKALRSVALLFHRRIVTTFALSALQNNQFTGHNSTTYYLYSAALTTESVNQSYDNYPEPPLQAIRDMSQFQVIT